MKPRDHSSTAAAAPPQSDYASAVTRVAVAQICRTAGYEAAEASAIAVLTDIAGVYLKAIAKSAASSANSHGRTESNLLDVIAALEELGSAQGFEGAWRAATHSALSSSVMREVEKFVRYTEETPFAKPLPKNAFSRRKIKLRKRGVDEYNEGRFRHVPKWLPSMPEIEKEEEKLGGFGMGMKGETETETEKKTVKREEKGRELPMKRIRVRFKLLKRKQRNGGIEESMKSGGVCRGGIGKRVSCENHDDNGRKEEKKKMPKMAKCPNKHYLSLSSNSIILS